LKIAVVILNWNGKALLQKFLPDVIRYSPTEYAEIYVVDNASTDDSVAYIREHFSTVHIIVNTENGGYAKGYNDGLKSIAADVYCLLNSDIEVTEDWLEPMYRHFKAHPQTAVAQPKLLDYKRKTHFEYAGAAGGFVDRLGYPYCRGRIFDTVEPDINQFEDEFPIFWASGACLFIRSNVFWELGGMDENYFAHQEEIDLCWRAFHQGYQTMYVGTSTVYHVGGASLSHAHWRKTFLNFRNSLFNLVKNVPGNYGCLLFYRLVLDGVAGVKFLLSGKPIHTWAVLKAHFSFYYHLPNLLQKRKEIPQKRAHYFTVKSIVWEYYVKKKKHFKDL
jgi:GT2 family glycosyltransferase